MYGVLLQPQIQYIQAPQQQQVPQQQQAPVAVLAQAAPPTAVPEPVAAAVEAVPDGIEVGPILSFQQQCFPPCFPATDEVHSNNTMAVI